MNNKKYLYMILILLMLIVGISSVSAENMTNAISSEIDNVNSVSNYGSTYIVTPEEFSEMIQSGSYQDGDIFNITDGDAIISYEATISKNIKIIGNGNVTFQGEDNGYFKITADNVEINRINFIYFKNAKDTSGAAIHWTGNYGTLTNCNFFECSSFTDLYGNQRSGGAVYIGEVQTSITNCTFTNCYSNYWGGAIYLYKTTGEINNCTFKNCAALSYAADKTYYADGGAIAWEQTSSSLVINCNFESCSSNKYGGAIRYWKVNNAEIINCNFNLCSVVNLKDTSNYGYGGAIYGGGLSYIIDNCTFTNCYSNNYGGAVLIYSKEGGYHNITNCIFKDCNATNGGGSLFMDDYSNNALIFNCKFENSLADTGGAIYFNILEKDSVIGCKFISCNANKEGGAIFLYEADTTQIIDSDFVSCFAGDYGGAITSVKGSNVGVTGSNFTLCSANKNGGAITLLGSPTSIIETCNFEDCSCISGKSISYLTLTEDEYIYYSDNGVLENNNFYYSDYDTYPSIYNEANNLSVIGGNGALILNKGKISSPVTVIILNNEIVKVPKGSSVKLSAIIKTGNYTIIGPEFSFVVKNNKYIGLLSGVNYIATYSEMINLDEIVYVYGSYLAANNVTYKPAILIGSKYPVNITGKNTTVPYGDEIDIIINITTQDTNISQATLYLTINMEKHTFDVNVSNETITVNLPKLNSGVYFITAQIENEKYLSNVASFVLNVTKTNGILIITADNITYEDFATLNITTSPEMTGLIYLTVNEKLYILPANTSTFKIPELLPADEYHVIGIYTHDINFNDIINTTNFTVFKISTVTNVNVDNSSNELVICIKSTDIRSNPIDGSADIVINGSNGFYQVFSIDIKEGVGSLTLNNLKNGEYAVNVTFNPTIIYEKPTRRPIDNYNKSFGSCSFEIAHIPLWYKLTASDVIKLFDNDTQYHVKVTDNWDNIIANATVHVIVTSPRWYYGVNYTIDSNEDGVATLPIHLISGDYKIIATFGNATAKNNITVLPITYILKANNVDKYFENDTQYVVKVTDQYGNAAVNRTVTVTVNRPTWKKPVDYKIVTDKNGIATLSIHLIAGSYTAVAKLAENSFKSTINVRPILTASNVVKKISQSDSLKAMLVDGQGNPAAGKTVTFKVKDTIYDSTTNADGIASLPIHLKVGNWSVLITNPETKAYTWATVKVIK